MLELILINLIFKKWLCKFIWLNYTLISVIVWGRQMQRWTFNQSCWPYFHFRWTYSWSCTGRTTPVRILIDGGATGDFMSLTEAKRLRITTQKSSMNVIQTDGEYRLDVVGEVNINFHRDDHILKFNGVIVKKLDEGILGGIPFQEKLILVLVLKITLFQLEMILTRTNQSQARNRL